VGVSVSLEDLIVSHVSRRRLKAIGAGLALAIGSVTGLAAEAGVGGAETTRVSVTSSGAQGNASSEGSSISAHGRFVAFSSNATNLVRGDTNGRRDVFVHDRKTGRTERVNVSSSGRQPKRGGGGIPSISAGGRFVAFLSRAADLVRADTNGAYDIFVHDRKTGRTERASVSSSGAEANRSSFDPSISADGRFVAFSSMARNLVHHDSNRESDIFVHDRRTGKTKRVSVRSSGEQTTSPSSGHPAISADGRFVAFNSLGSLVDADTNSRGDVYTHDRRTGRTRLASIGPGGDRAIGGGRGPSISADGRFVAFQSSPGLIPDRNAEILIRDRRMEETRAIDVLRGDDNPDEDISRPSISANGRLIAFESYATNLVPGDTNGLLDVFVHDRQRGATTRVSVSSAGLEAHRESAWPMISADGRFVTFSSKAGNLVRPDTNRKWDAFVHGPLR
jgi:Tol biopolymer transport system component